MNKKNQFVFKKHARIGAPAAEEDEEYLSSCFVDIGDLDILRNCKDPRRIILGRTGSGKSALLLKLKELEERAIAVEPEELALERITNSQIFRFLLQTGVKLDIFFKLLWRHVFVIEILRDVYEIYDQQAKESFIEYVLRLVKKDPERTERKAVLDYMERWGDQFWKETDKRTIDTTERLEGELSGAIGSALPGVKMEALSSIKLSQEEKAKVVERTQDVVNRVQIKELSEMFDFLREDALADPQKKYFVLVDRLDEQWIDDRLRFLLIRALIETARDFQRVPNCKIVLALRSDLIERVFRYTRDAGFQEEKYRGLYMKLYWTPDQLKQLVDKRVNALIEHKYTKKGVELEDVMVDSVHLEDQETQETIDYMLERTMQRPRDIIAFFNACIKQAVDRPRITQQMVYAAEGEYSKTRFRALGDEWYADYPHLLDFAKILKGRQRQFCLKELDVDQFFLETLTGERVRPAPTEGPLYELGRGLIEEETDACTVRQQLAYVFYKVGLVGLKPEGHRPVCWSYTTVSAVSEGEIHDDARVHIHPGFYRVLGIRF